MRLFSVIPILACLAFVFVACPQRSEDPNTESFDRGKLELLCDEEISPIISPNIRSYLASHPGSSISLHSTSAREAMTALLGATSRIVVTSREYLSDEDSLMKKFNVKKHRSFHLATDAIVFFTSKKVAKDSCRVSALKDVFSKNVSYVPASGRGSANFAISSHASSVYAQLAYYCGERGKIVNTKLRFCGRTDSVKTLVEKNQTLIGIAFLSQLANDTNRFNFIRIGYADTTEDTYWVLPHQSSIYREKYPFRVNITAYLLEDLKNFPMGVASYLAYEADPQKSFLNAGIVPAYARIRLYEE